MMFKRLWKQLRSDWVRVLMAFVLACMIYLLRSDLFSSAVESKEFFNIPVQLEYTTSNMINLDNNINTVSITFEGSPHRIRKLNTNNISVIVPVDQTHLNNGIIELSEKNVKAPLGIRVKELHPRRMLVNLEVIENKKVKVTPVFDSLDKLSENYSIAGTKIFPAEIMISGPKSKIQDITEVFTSPIPLDNTIQDSFKYQASIASIAEVDTAPSEVSCNIMITRNFTKRIIKKVPVQMMLRSNTDLQFSINPAVVDVEISGPLQEVNAIKAEDLDVFINANNITKPGEYILNIRCSARSNEIKIGSVTPIRLTLTAR